MENGLAIIGKSSADLAELMGLLVLPQHWQRLNRFIRT